MGSSEVVSFEGRILELLEGVRTGTVDVAAAASTLRDLPFSDLSYARVDHHRELRTPMPEIVYGPGKTTDQVRGIVEALLANNLGPIVVTRCTEDQRSAVAQLAEVSGHPIREARAIGTIAIARNVRETSGKVVVTTGGTADLPVAEEAALIAELLGTKVEMIPDIGVAGLHRVLAVRERLRGADAIVVVAGMEGAIASVIGGLVAAPVVACPTSVGYGASFGGLAALLAMLSSCVPGVACVNIDDGVGAGYIAALIATR